MDLSNFKANKNTVVSIKHPTTGDNLFCDDEKKDGMTWTLISKHTAEYKRLAAGFAGKMRDEFGDKKLSDLSVSELELLDLMTTELTVESTTGFNLFIDGKKAAFSKEAAKEILCDESYFWLKDQVAIGANDVENFILA